MVDWLTWPAELVLSAGGIVASWFVSKDSLSFVALQMGFALLVLAAVVSLFAYLPALVGYWRSRSQINRPLQLSVGRSYLRHCRMRCWRTVRRLGGGRTFCLRVRIPYERYIGWPNRTGRNAALFCDHRSSAKG